MQTLAVRRYGNGPHRVIGVHGWIGEERAFARLEEALDPQLFSCAWVSLRGIGASRSVPGEYTVGEIAEDVLGLGTELGWPKFSVVGHSMGGKAALLAAARAPERVIRALLLAPVSPNPVPMPAEQWSTFDRAASDPQYMETVIREAIGRPVPEAWAGHLARETIERTAAAVLRAYLHSWVRDNTTAELVGCKVPTLVIVGEHDAMITRAAVTGDLAGLLSELEVVEMPNAGHFLLDEAPLRVGHVAVPFLLGVGSESTNDE